MILTKAALVSLLVLAIMQTYKLTRYPFFSIPKIAEVRRAAVTASCSASIVQSAAQLKAKFNTFVLTILRSILYIAFGRPVRAAATLTEDPVTDRTRRARISSALLLLSPPAAVFVIRSAFFRSPYCSKKSASASEAVPVHEGRPCSLSRTEFLNTELTGAVLQKSAKEVRFSKDFTKYCITQKFKI